jgi:aminodeoxyfutalosine deaminase
MKRFSAQYIFTNTDAPLKKGIINTDEDGKIIRIEDTHGAFTERDSVQFYNGIIIPGFVNCHCHMELSHLKSSVKQGIGLGHFIKEIRENREREITDILSASRSADNEMYLEGIVLCADICNTSDTFSIKKKSRISYLNLLEVFGLDPSKATGRMDEITKVGKAAEALGLPFTFVPHSVYSLSFPLLRLLRKKCENNIVTSIHFMESVGEADFLKNKSGELMIYYKEFGLIPDTIKTSGSHSNAILKEVTASGNLILVHNTYADRITVKEVNQRGKTFWCMCPKSNIYIENVVPPVKMLLDEECDLVIGTDSLASNNRLSIIDELRTLQDFFPEIPLEEIIRWATLNGARALNVENFFGKIEPGKKPGLLLLQNIDLTNLKLLPESFVTRLI